MSTSAPPSRSTRSSRPASPATTPPSSTSTATPEPDEGRARSCTTPVSPQGEADPVLHARSATAPPPSEECRAIAKQLNASGLFDVDVKSTPSGSTRRASPPGSTPSTSRAGSPTTRTPTTSSRRSSTRATSSTLHLREQITDDLIPPSARQRADRTTRPRTSRSSRTSSPTTCRSSAVAGQAVRGRPQRHHRRSSGPSTPRPSSGSGSSASSPEPVPPRPAAGGPTPAVPATARRGAPDRSRTRTPRPAPGRAGPASSAHGPHAS